MKLIKRSTKIQSGNISRKAFINKFNQEIGYNEIFFLNSILIRYILR